MVTPLGKDLFHLLKGVAVFYGLMINHGKRNADGKSLLVALSCGQIRKLGIISVFGKMADNLVLAPGMNQKFGQTNRPLSILMFGIKKSLGMSPMLGIPVSEKRDTV